jgi:hypothetical protein
MNGFQFAHAAEDNGFGMCLCQVPNRRLHLLPITRTQTSEPPGGKYTAGILLEKVGASDRTHPVTIRLDRRIIEL